MANGGAGSAFMTSMGGPWGVGLAAVGAVAGYFSMRSRRKSERRRRGKEKIVAEKAQKGMIGSLAEIKEEYAQKATMAREGYAAQRERTQMGFEVRDMQAQSQIGQTGLSYSGGAERQRSLVGEDYANQTQQNRLGYESQFWNIERALESDLRGVKTGLLNLEATAAQRGYKIPGVGETVDTSSNLGGFK